MNHGKLFQTTRGCIKLGLLHHHPLLKSTFRCWYKDKTGEYSGCLLNHKAEIIYARTDLVFGTDPLVTQAKAAHMVVSKACEDGLRNIILGSLHWKEI